MQKPTRVQLFLQWLRTLLFDLLHACAQAGEQSEAVWQAAAGALAHLLAEGGRVPLGNLAGLSTEAVAVLLDAAQRHAWCALLASG